MIVKEFFMTRSDGVKLFRTYSDEGKYVIQNETGVEYSEAVDVENAPYTYSEGELIEEYSEIELKAQAYDVITGVSE